MFTDEFLDDLHQRLANRSEEVCRMLLPGGKRVGHTWQCGGVDGSPGKSMGVELDGEKVGVWHDRATNESGRLLKLFQLCRGLTFNEAVQHASDFLGVAMPAPEDRRVDPSNFHFEMPAPARDPDAPPPYVAPAPRIPTVIDWTRCVNELTPEKAAELCEWRGYSVEHVTWMKEQELVGCFEGQFAFPVHNAKGEVVAIHYKADEGWRYWPKGAHTAPLIIGSPTHAVHTLAFESQWDAFSVLDKLGAHEPDNAGIYAAYITRSATSNTDISKLAIVNLIAVNQNDPKEKTDKDGVTRANTNKEGRTPSEEWLHQIQSSRNRVTQFAVFEPPAPHKDANDWIRAEHPNHAEVFRKVIELSRNPILKSAKSVKDLLNHQIENDPNAIIGYEKRFLSKGGSWMIIGPSGIGKSTLITSLCINAAAGVTWHGLTFRKPLKTLVVQAENDPGDLAEMLKGGCAAVRNEFTNQQFLDMSKNLMFQQVTDKIGEKFTRWLEEIIREISADLVVIDPLLSFVGDDISQQKVASQFFRNWVQPVLERTGVICILVHHTGKPSKDKDGQKGWTDSDFSYIGLGSSEIVNWPRAVSVLIHTKEKGTFLFKNCKRGGRALMVDQFTRTYSQDIYLRHGTGSEGSQWLQTKYEEPEEEEKKPAWKGGKEKKAPPDPMTFLPYIAACSTYHDIYTIIREKSGLYAGPTKAIISSLQAARALIKGEDGYFRKVINDD